MPALPFKDMGPCEIVLGYGESGALNLGPFLGATTFKGVTSVEKIYEERFGNAAVDAIFSGTEATLEARMTRSTLDQLNEVLNAGGILGSEPYQYIKLKNQAGCNLYAGAKRVVIKPICNNAVSVDPSEWVEVYKVVPIPGWELTWDRSTQRIFPISFLVFVSQESGEEGEFGQAGMPAGSTELGI